MGESEVGSMTNTLVNSMGSDFIDGEADTFALSDGATNQQVRVRVCVCGCVRACMRAFVRACEEEVVMNCFHLCARLPYSLS